MAIKLVLPSLGFLFYVEPYIPKCVPYLLSAHTVIKPEKGEHELQNAKVALPKWFRQFIMIEQFINGFSIDIMNSLFLISASSMAVCALGGVDGGDSLEMYHVQ